MLHCITGSFTSKRQDWPKVHKLMLWRNNANYLEHLTSSLIKTNLLPRTNKLKLSSLSMQRKLWGSWTMRSGRNYTTLLKQKGKQTRSATFLLSCTFNMHSIGKICRNQKTSRLPKSKRSQIASSSVHSKAILRAMSKWRKFNSKWFPSKNLALRTLSYFISKDLSMRTSSTITDWFNTNSNSGQWQTAGLL